MADASLQPALDTPPGVVSQFPTTHSSEQAWWYVCVVLCTVIPGILLIVRLYTKLYVVRKADVSDYMIVLAFLLAIALLACGRLLLQSGAGVHQWNLTIGDLSNVLYWLYVVEVMYGPAIFLVKATILLQYTRIFAPQKIVNPFMWWATRFIIVITGIYYTISSMITLLACTPREAIWNPLITDAHCLDNDLLVFITCLFNIISDIIILLLPARAVWKLRIPAKKKIGIVLLFAIGLLACIANALIIVYILRSSGDDADVSFNTEGLGLWALAELTLGIIVACTFLLPKFFEAKGSSIRGLLSSFARPFTTSNASSTNWARSTNWTRRKRSTSGVEEGTDGSSHEIGQSDRDLPLRDYASEIEGFHAQKGIPPVPAVHIATYPKMGP